MKTLEEEAKEYANELVEAILVLAFIAIYMLDGGPRTKKIKKQSIVVEFIKAKYNRYCPTIEWEEKEK